MPTIRIDDEVYAWLQSQARAFEDSPNSVMRRVAGLRDTGSTPEPPPSSRTSKASRVEPIRSERLTGEVLARRWGVTVRHALYHRDGMFYENLTRFPGALFDPSGFIIFHTAPDYRKSMYLRIGEKLNVPGGIAAIPGYMRMVK